MSCAHACAGAPHLPGGRAWRLRGLLSGLQQTRPGSASPRSEAAAGEGRLGPARRDSTGPASGMHFEAHGSFSPATGSRGLLGKGQAGDLPSRRCSPLRLKGGLESTSHCPGGTHSQGAKTQGPRGVTGQGGIGAEGTLKNLQRLYPFHRWDGWGSEPAAGRAGDRGTQHPGSWDLLPTSWLPALGRGRGGSCAGNSRSRRLR